MDTTNLFSQYASHIRTLNLDAIPNAKSIPREFLLGQEGKLASYYVPFDVVNASAKVVLVGITPGFTQWKNAVAEAQRQLQTGATLDAARIAAKRAGAFSGALRPKLIELLDMIGVQRWLGIESCDSLFTSHSNLVHTTSIVRHATFIDGENYKGTPNMIKTPFLRQKVLQYFANEVAQLPNAVYIALGPAVSEGLSWLAKEGVLKEGQILAGLPHPAGPNAERIAYFLGRKEKSKLSIKTNAAKLDLARATLVRQVGGLR